MLERFLKHRLAFSRQDPTERDAEGATEKSFVPVAQDIRCLAQPRTSSRVVDQGQVESATTYRIYFGSYQPGIEVGDLVEVIGLSLIAQGPSVDEAGWGESHHVDAAVRA